jgi:hypothetical protein
MSISIVTPHVSGSNAAAMRFAATSSPASSTGHLTALTSRASTITPTLGSSRIFSGAWWHFQAINQRLHFVSTSGLGRVVNEGRHDRLGFAENRSDDFLQHGCFSFGTFGVKLGLEMREAGRRIKPWLICPESADQAVPG